MNKQNGQAETELAEMRLDEETPEYNKQRAEVIYKILRKEGAHRILDVGCGLGKVSVHLAQQGLDVTGIDISKNLIGLARKKSREHEVNVNFEVIELKEFRPKERFDAVLFVGVLEHINDEVQMMKDAHHVLKTNGKIVITDMPTFKCLFMERDRRIGHYRRYNKKDVMRNLKAAGYSNIKLKYYNFLMLFGTLYPPVFKKGEYPYGILNPILRKFLYLWYRYLENNFVFPIGDRFIAVATLHDLQERDSKNGFP